MNTFKKMIKVDVVELEWTANTCARKGIYINRGIKPVLISLDVIAELWPVEDVNLTEPAPAYTSDCNKIVGTMKVARLYTISGRSEGVNGTETRKYITEESYSKICSQFSIV